jgi:hypothetical protein
MGQSEFLRRLCGKWLPNVARGQELEVEPMRLLPAPTFYIDHGQTASGLPDQALRTCWLWPTVEVIAVTGGRAS